MAGRGAGQVVQCPICFNETDCRTAREADLLERQFYVRIRQHVARAMLTFHNYLITPNKRMGK